MAKQEMTLSDWFDDLCVRFILNLPVEERSSLERLCFQIEEAQWYYEDFIRPLNPSLPSMNLKPFSQKFFQHIFSGVGKEHYMAAFSRFVDYKTRVPVRGAILLNKEMDQVVLVKGWKKGARWSFPRGKINKDERDLACAIREVYEETGLDLHKTTLLEDESKMKSIKVTMRDQEIMVFVVRGVSMDTVFEPQTRKEISDIAWYKISDLPTMKVAKSNSGRANMFYMVAPFVGPLMKWIDLQHKAELGSTKDSSAPLPQMGGLSEGMQHESPAPENPIPSMPAAGLDKSAELMRLLNIGSAPDSQPAQSSFFSSEPHFEPSSLVPSGILSNSTPAVSYNQPLANASVAPTCHPADGRAADKYMESASSQRGTDSAMMNPALRFVPPQAQYRSLGRSSGSETAIAGLAQSAERPREGQPKSGDAVPEYSSMPLPKHSQALLSIFNTPSPRPSTTNPVVPAPIPRPSTAIGVQKSSRKEVSKDGVVDTARVSPTETPAGPSTSNAPPHPHHGSRAVSGPGNLHSSNQKHRDRRRAARGAGNTGPRENNRRASEFRPNPQKPITILSRPKPVPTEGAGSIAPIVEQNVSPVKTASPPALRSAKSAFDVVSSPKTLTPGSRRPRGRNTKENSHSTNASDEDANSHLSPTKTRQRHRSRSRRRTAAVGKNTFDPAPEVAPIPSPEPAPTAATQPSILARPSTASPSTEASNKSFFLGFLAGLKK